MPSFSKILILDFETRWSRSACDWAPDGYSLSDITTEEYIRSPLFCAFGVGYKWYGEEGSAVWIRGSNLRAFFDSIDWATTAVCCHNAQFDVAIVTWIYGKKPAFIFDTLSMARALRGIEVGNSAAKLAKEFGLPEKGRALHSTDGLWDLSFDVEKELAEYCKHDVFLCEEFLNRLLPGYPKSELRLVDATIRMFTEPQLGLDAALLTMAIAEEEEARTALLARLGVTDTQLASNDKFAELLRDLGTDPPTKISRTTKKEIFAFAKNDALFLAMLNGDNEDVVLLCEARIKVKSTQERTRAQRLLGIAGRGDGGLPVPLNYAHTRTLRWGAAKGSNINVQNMKRRGTLRKAIVARRGFYIVAGDLGQIEPRVLAYLSDFSELLAIFLSGKDVYAVFGAQMFGIPDLSNDTHPVLRQSAKSALLGAGYQLGWASFAAQLLTGFLGAPPVRYTKEFMKQLGIGQQEVAAFLDGKWGAKNYQRMQDIPHTCTEFELLVHCVCAKEIIDRYRATSQPIVSFWAFLEKMITTVLSVPNAAPVSYKCLQFEPGRIRLPNGLYINYDKIKCETDEQGRPSYSYWNGHTYKKLYAGVVCENVTSGIARCVIGDGMLRIQPRYRCALSVHDEGVWHVPEAEVEEGVEWIKQQMIAPVPYLPNLPLNAGVGYARRYGNAKG